jgi:hypothetical protein
VFFAAVAVATGVVAVVATVAKTGDAFLLLQIHDSALDKILAQEEHETRMIRVGAYPSA